MAVASGWWVVVAVLAAAAAAAATSAAVAAVGVRVCDSCGAAVFLLGVVCLPYWWQSR